MTHFACRELHGARLSPSACAARHSGAVSLLCERCPVGAAHAMGQRPARWPDGSPLVRLELVPPAAPAAVPKYVERIRDRGGEKLARGMTAEERAARLRAAKRRYEAKRRARRGERAPATTRKGCGVGVARGGETFAWDGRSLTLSQWAREPDVVALGLSLETIAGRIRVQGWSVERALTTPPSSHANLHTWGERTLRLSQWVREPEAVALGLTIGLLKRRVNEYRWPIERAVTTPIDTARQRITRRAS